MYRYKTVYLYKHFDYLCTGVVVAEQSVTYWHVWRVCPVDRWLASYNINTQNIHVTVSTRAIELQRNNRQRVWKSGLDESTLPLWLLIFLVSNVCVLSYLMFFNQQRKTRKSSS